MELSRRDFLKLSGATAGGAALLGALPKSEVFAAGSGAIPLRKPRLRESLTICPYDATGCGFIVAADGENVVNLEGDPDHPINEGSLCSKGSALYQVANNDRRLQHVMYRAPGSNHWEKKPWDWAINRISVS